MRIIRDAFVHSLAVFTLPLVVAGCGGALADGNAHAPAKTSSGSPARPHRGTSVNASQLESVSEQQQKLIDAVERNVESALRLTATGSLERPDDHASDSKRKKPKSSKHAEPGAPAPLSQSVASIRARNLPLTIVPAPEKSSEEKGILMLDYDAFKAGLEKVPPSTWKTDREGMTAATQNFAKVGGAVQASSLALVQTSILTPAVSIRGMVSIAHLKIEKGAWSSASWTPEDRAVVKRLIGDGKRSATIGAIATALVAGYQGVCNDKQDPKALDQYAEKTLAAFPVKVEVSDEEAASYVDGLDTSKLEDTHARYEAMLRETYGDATFEKKYKKNLDESFADLGKAHARAQEPPPARPGQGRSASAAPSSPPANGSGNGKVGAGLRTADAALRGDATGVLDNASDLLPADSSVRQTLKGVSSLLKGDTKGALKAALALVPLPGPAKDGINFVLGAFKLI